MSMTVQKLPANVHGLIFEKLPFRDFLRAIRVCKAWGEFAATYCSLSTIKYDESVGNLVIDSPKILFIDKNISVTGALLIRARDIYSKPDISLSGGKVTLVANVISYLGSIHAQTFDKYAAGVSYVKGPMPRGVSYSLGAYSANPDLWSSLKKECLDY